MRKFNENKALSFCEKYGSNRSTLRAIAGNLSAVRESSDERLPHLLLVWKQEGILAAKGLNTDKGKPRRVQPEPPSQVSQQPSWFREHAERIGVIVTILGGLAYGSWYLSKYDSRLINVETAVNGPDGLPGINKKLSEISDRLTKIEGKLEAVDKYVWPYVLPRIFGSQATALGFTDPQIVPVRLTKSSKVSVTVYGGKLSFTFTVEDVKEDLIYFSVAGIFKEQVPILDIHVSMPYQIGVPINLTKIVGMGVPMQDVPDVWVSILDFPSSDSAILAVGPRTSTTS